MQDSLLGFMLEDQDKFFGLLKEVFNIIEGDVIELWKLGSKIMLMSNKGAHVTSINAWIP